MPKEKTASKTIFDWLASLKLTLFLFFVLAAASVIGTLLPQGASLQELQGHFSPAMASLINFLALNNLYHSMWFRILLLLLCANLVTCTIDRFPKTIALLRSAESPFDSQKLSKFSLSESITSGLPFEQTLPVVESAVCKSFGGMCRVESAGPFCAVSETGRWSRLMVYVVHVSVLIVIAGALAGSILGFKGTMNLIEGETSDEVVLAESQSVHKLPFDVRCDRFEVSFYDTGAPKEFKSELSVIENGREVSTQSIVVNDPMTYDGITIYQASYGTALKNAEIELTDGTQVKRSR